jgi:diadenosine tetraphosphatase ApaH/serine/threonine PP2A family protein phosphatase
VKSLVLIVCSLFFPPLSSGLMCELLWSDPQPFPGRGPSKRGVGLSFGKDVTQRFLQDNNLGRLSCSGNASIAFILGQFSHASQMNRFSCAIS